jgi:hypothetical protein
MLRYILGLLFSVIFFPQIAVADQDFSENEKIPLEAKEKILKLYPGAIISDWKSGDLDRDGIADVVAMIADTSADKERIIVLKGSVLGKYELLGASGPFESDRGTRRTKNLRVRKNSFFLSGGGPADDESVESMEFQFQYYKKNFSLVGFKYTWSKNKEPVDREWTANFLTGKRVEWLKIKSKRKSVETISRIEPLIKLEQFSWNPLFFDDNKWTISPDSISRHSRIK